LPLRRLIKDAASSSPLRDPRCIGRFNGGKHPGWKRRIAGQVRGMIDQTKTKVIFACPPCNLAHEVTQTHSHTKKAGGFDCADCGAAVHFWYGFFDYSDWRAIERLALLTAG
jgi:predicted RNA-binding Zn-ribbon protein involved in translation (DUF1610 family)